MDDISRTLFKGIAIAFVVVLTLPVLVVNTYISFQTWAGNVINLRFPVLDNLKRFHRPISLSRRHVLLAFVAGGLFPTAILLPILIWYDQWNLIPWLSILALILSVNGALGRYRSLRYLQNSSQMDS